MNRRPYEVITLPGYKSLLAILDDPGSGKSDVSSARIDDYLEQVYRILGELGLPTNIFDIDALAGDYGEKRGYRYDVAVSFSQLIRLANLAKSALVAGEIDDYGYYMGQLGKVTASAEYLNVHEFAVTGMKSYTGSMKASLKRMQSAPKLEHQEIRDVANQMLKAGTSERELSSRLRRRFAGIPGYPQSQQSYRRIIRGHLAN